MVTVLGIVITIWMVFMNKTLLVSSLVACLSIASVNVYAEGKNSISVGYAQSHVKEDGYKLDKDPRGFNLKYRYEFNNNWGVIGSFAQTRRGSRNPLADSNLLMVILSTTQ